MERSRTMLTGALAESLANGAAAGALMMTTIAAIATHRPPGQLAAAAAAGAFVGGWLGVMFALVGW